MLQYYIGQVDSKRLSSDFSTVFAVTRPYTKSLDLLRSVGLRPTRQRLALARLLFEGPDQHVTAEHLHGLARDSDVRVSLATVYNTLHQFRQAGLLREVVVEPGRSYFDTNTSDHHHFFDSESGALTDIPFEDVQVSSLPQPPDGRRVERVDVVVRLARS